MAARHLLLASLALAALTGCGPDAAQAEDEPTIGRADLPTYQDVLVISIDGLRSDALLAVSEDRIPHFTRLMTGAFTLNARTDPDYTVTMPNHTGMVTSRTVKGPGGHGWASNDPKEGDHIEEHLSAEVSNAFRAAKDAGMGSSMFVTKLKFRLMPWTWNDDEQDPAIQDFVLEHKASRPALKQLQDHLLARKDEQDFIFVHLHDMDTRGHADGWNLTRNSPYLQTMFEVDAMLGELLAVIDGDEALASSTAIILTSDHGGGVPYLNHHGQGLQWVNYVIPFIVWTSDGQASGELYELNPQARQDPSLTMPAFDAWPPPVRNLDAGNLALGLLGLEPLVGSNVNAGQELAIR